eukprot:TRINITY_DN82568_c0_g1_i1.p1 TRINITY_DN82568_c0_g1~~TRINITY_DN82568_c0_g1_i1.p1  ORF type:complete len:567 (+),score=117.76 TRINITY_DN82568_c0_g1_i1:87-1787(+)
MPMGLLHTLSALADSLRDADSKTWAKALAALAAGVPAAAFVGHALWTWVEKQSLPPGPWPYPFLGNFPHLVNSMPPHRSLQALHKKYGPLLTLWYGNKLTIVVGCPSLIKQTHRDQSEKFQHRTLTAFAKLSLQAEPDTTDLPPCCQAYSGKNVALSGGKYWIKARKVFVQELMSKKFIEQDCVPKIMEEVWSTIDAIKELGGAAFDPHEHLQRLSCNIVYRLTYGIRFKRTDIGNHSSDWGQLHDVINSIMRLGGQNVKANYVPLLALKDRLTPSGRALNKKRSDTINTRNAILARLLEEHKAAFDPQKPRDFLDVLLTRKDKDKLTDQEITFIAWEFITAGTDTTSATIHWLLLLMANHPDVQKKVQAEIDAVCKGRPVDINDATKMPYMNACIKECMRWMPAVPLMVPYMASLDADVVLESGRRYTIKQGTQVIMNGFNMHRDPALWDRPDEFIPERFMDGPDADIELKGADAPSDPHHLKFMPLGTGRRACAGALLAKLELFVQGATLLQCFQWLPAQGDKVALKEVFGIAVSAAHVDVVAKWRSESGIDLKKAVTSVGAQQ